MFAVWVYYVEKKLGKPSGWTEHLDRWVPIVTNVTFGVGAFLLTSEKTAMSRTFILSTLTLCLI